MVQNILFITLCFSSNIYSTTLKGLRTICSESCAIILKICWEKNEHFQIFFEQITEKNLTVREEKAPVLLTAFLKITLSSYDSTDAIKAFRTSKTAIIYFLNIEILLNRLHKKLLSVLNRLFMGTILQSQHVSWV